MGCIAGGRNEGSPSAGHKRLFGLWLICVLFGLCAVLNFLNMLMGTPLGMIIFGAFSVLFIASAVYLWLRCRRAWLAAIVLWLIWIAFGLVFHMGLPTIGEILLWGLISLAIIAYLVWRRRYFGAPAQPRPSLKSPLFLTTFGFIAVLFALAIGLSVDDKPLEFTELEFAPIEFAPEENGYTIFKQIQDEKLFKEPEETEVRCLTFPEIGTDEFSEWLVRARGILTENATCLDKIEEMLSRPHFVFPPPSFPFCDIERGALARNLARLLLVECNVQLADGHPTEAMESALDALQLGVSWAGERGVMIDDLVGLAIRGMALEQVQRVAASPGAQKPLLETTLRRLTVEEAMREAFVNSVRGEFHQQKAMFEFLSNLKKSREDTREFLCWAMPSEVARPTRWTEKLIGNIRLLLKVNMSVNWLGRHFQELIGVAEESTYDEDPTAIAPPIRTTDWLRNPIGTILNKLMLPGESAWLTSHFRCVADVRATRLFIALRAYHLDNGRLAQSLNALMPNYIEEVPLDPFSGEQFGFEPAAERPRLFSVGPDGEKDATDEPEMERDDIIIELSFARH